MKRGRNLSWTLQRNRRKFYLKLVTTNRVVLSNTEKLVWVTLTSAHLSKSEHRMEMQSSHVLYPKIVLDGDGDGNVDQVSASYRC